VKAKPKSRPKPAHLLQQHQTAQSNKTQTTNTTSPATGARIGANVYFLNGTMRWISVLLANWFGMATGVLGLFFFFFFLFVLKACIITII
jgi:hypothetical protein